MLKDKYYITMGISAEDVIGMFKYLLLKTYFKVSERCLVRRTKTYNVTIKDDTHIDQMDYMKTDEFKELYAE